MRHLRNIIFDKRISSNWSMDQLPLVQRIFNATPKERTGVTPAELIFGNSLILDKHVFPNQEVKSDSSRLDVPKYLGDLLLRQKAL